MKELGEQPATVVTLQPNEGDGAPTVTVAVRYDDGRVEQSDLRPDLVPEGLAAGDRVGVTQAALYRRWTLRRLDA